MSTESINDIIKQIFSQYGPIIKKIPSDIRENPKKLKEKVPEYIFIPYFTWYFDGQIRNGGFSQYYYNTWGYDGGITIYSLEKIGAEAQAKVLDKSYNLFLNDYMENDLENLKAFLQGQYFGEDKTGMREKLNKHNSEYLNLEPELTGFLQKYIEAHQDKILEALK